MKIGFDPGLTEDLCQQCRDAYVHACDGLKLVEQGNEEGIRQYQEGRKKLEELAERPEIGLAHGLLPALDILSKDIIK